MNGVHGLLFSAAARWPDRRALSTRDGDWTFSDLANAALRVAAWCDFSGVGGGDRVLCISKNSGQLIAALFGVMASGAIVVPVHPDTPARGIQHYRDDSRPRALIVSAASSQAHASLEGIPVLEVAAGPPDARWPPGDLGYPTSPSEVGPNDVAAFMYTSGSSGPPRAVICPHSQVLFATSAIGQALGYKMTDRVFCAIPLSFDYGMYQVFLALGVGAELFVEPDLSSVHLIPSQLARHDITVLPAMPSVLSMLLRTQLLERTRLPHLRLVTSTGDHLPEALIERVTAAIPRTQVVPMYGLTECKRVSVRLPEDQNAPLGSVGRPLNGTHARIIDDQGNPAAAGEPGELVVSGPHVMAGYWNAREETQQRFRPTPHGTVELHTGDTFHQDADGYLFFEGRSDSIIKCLGHRVSPAQVESVLMRIPGLREAAVLGTPHPIKGQEIVAFVAPADAARVTELQAHCEAHLVSSECPTRYEFVGDNLPKTNQGKIDRAHLCLLAATRDGTRS